MSRTYCSERGISLIEVIIAIFLTTVGVLAVLSLQPAAWRTVGKSDYLGRAAGILHEELERREALIMNPNNAVAVGETAATVLTSGQGAAVAGDAAYTVTTTITSEGAGFWRVEVAVEWANQLSGNYRNVEDSIVVTRQNAYAF